MSIDIFLRPMTREDLPSVNLIRNHETTRSFLRNTNTISLDETYAWFDNTHPNWWMIINNQEIVGYVRSSLDTKETICIGCDIHPDMRKRGFAKSAYKNIISKLYKEGYLVIWLEVFTNNIAALKLYQKLNFQVINTRKVGNREAAVMVHIRQDDQC
jgi:ribosomal protein S18 acetylase RimI-like enzyme